MGTSLTVLLKKPFALFRILWTPLNHSESLNHIWMINITTVRSFHMSIFPSVYRSQVLHYLQVYTINLESRYLMVQGVPAIGVMTELIQLCALYGAVEEYRPLDEYPAEEFTEVYLVKFQKLTSARYKMSLDCSLCLTGNV